MPLTDQELREKHSATLEVFIMRARRVEQHSLVRTPEELVKLAQVTQTLQMYSTGETFLIQQFPPEEAVESAAARVRPLILENESTFHGKVMAAIGYFATAGGAPDAVRGHFQSLKKQWTAIKPASKDASGYYVQMSGDGMPQAVQATDNMLGFAWIYGDVIHNDLARLAETSPFGIGERFRAAAPLVARIMVLTINTLNLVRALQAAGLVPPLTGAHDTPVVVTDTTWKRQIEAYVADPVRDGTPVEIPPIGQPLGAEWKNARDVLLQRIPPTAP